MYYKITFKLKVKSFLFENILEYKKSNIFSNKKLKLKEGFLIQEQ